MDHPKSIFSYRESGGRLQTDDLIRKVGTLMEVVKAQTPLVHQVNDLAVKMSRC
jgi:hypothetical protein